MAIVKDPLMKGISGKVGDQFYYRQYGGNTILCKRPKRNKSRPRSKEELRRQKKFRDALFYARDAIRDPDMLAMYQALAGNGKTAYNMAMSDALKPPVLSKLNAKQYRGLPGNILEVKAEDNVCVTSVSFTIYAPDGSEVERGEAIPHRYSWQWRYTITTLNNTPKGSVIRVVAEDMPGNQTVLEHIV